MALFNEILVARFNRALQKALGIKGNPPAPQIASEITAQVQLFWGVDMAYLEGWNRFGGRVQAAAVAGNFSGFRLRNPAGSKVLAVVERIAYSVNQVTNVFLTIERPATSATFPLVGSVMPWDARVSSVATGGGNNCLLEGKNNNATVFGTIVGIFNPTAINASNEIIPASIQMAIPILPGDSLDVTANLANTALDDTIWWRERILEDSEVT